MPNQFRLIYQGSPFLPQFDSQAMVAEILQVLSPTFEPAAAISLGDSTLMAVHCLLLRLERDTLARHQVSEANLKLLTLGFNYPLETILASTICKKLPVEKRDLVYEQLLVPTHDYLRLRIQDQIAQDLKATINLLKLDPSGALVFQFIKDYPFSKDEFFLNGLEISALIYFGIALEVAKATGDDSWLNTPYDPTDLG